MFYTLFGSFPLLISLFSLFYFLDTSYMFFRGYDLVYIGYVPSGLMCFWWFFSILGFLVKLPVYGFHLWLPKAHVEAPVAGSMLLAALLLKLGGYGLIRISRVLECQHSVFFVGFCFWGSLVTRIICLRQSDLKALIAYSSVGHMRLVAGGIILNTS